MQVGLVSGNPVTDLDPVVNLDPAMHKLIVLVNHMLTPSQTLLYRSTLPYYANSQRRKKLSQVLATQILGGDSGVLYAVNGSPGTQYLLSCDGSTLRTSFRRSRLLPLYLLCLLNPHDLNSLL